MLSRIGDPRASINRKMKKKKRIGEPFCTFKIWLPKDVIFFE